MKSIVREIRDIQAMSVTELQAKWRELYGGEVCLSRSRSYMVKKLSWRVQELAYGVPAPAEDRIEEPAPNSPVRPRTTTTAVLSRAPRNVHRISDPRRPTPGTIITREWHGRELRLLVVENGFELDGVRYASLSEAARVATGQRWSGPLFWGLKKRSRKS